MRAAALDEELVVQNSIVLVGNRFIHHLLVFSGGHEEQVLQRIVQIAAVVHVHVSGAAVPASLGHVDEHAALPFWIALFGQFSNERRCRWRSASGLKSGPPNARPGNVPQGNGWRRCGSERSGPRPPRRVKPSLRASPCPSEFPIPPSQTAGPGDLRILRLDARTCLTCLAGTHMLRPQSPPLRRHQWARSMLVGYFSAV